MTTKAFQKIYTKINQITKATCTLKAQDVGYDELALIDGRLAQVAVDQRVVGKGTAGDHLDAVGKAAIDLDNGDDLFHAQVLLDAQLF